ncbi:aminobutyraldehyde dehydrogenase [Mycetocola spongiae]|uniref:aminobutyraldehyde dehydrogenase n=1 Tax=Mycetocola spongiae TaxID=2859226 RepID=UPI001CF42102|nr:aminobutyraldehyde dehydrogenase [Mycetocola spongiae]UCR87953.1 aminobutyraldehyde dehydrogenase [Mycetocola spongiae]
MTQDTLKNYINGRFISAHGEKTLNVVSPVTEEVVALSPVSDETDVNAAFAAAEAASRTWKRTTPGQRQHALLALADAIEANADALVAAQVRNTGQPIETVRAEEILTGADQIRFFAGAARNLEGKSAGEYVEGFTSFVRREPIGVVAQVTPWNYPFLMAIWKIGPALAAGNTIVLKPSDTTPESTLELARIATGILPDGVLNVVLGDASTGTLLTESPVPGLVAITGSVRAGQAVATSAAKNVHRVHLELGGKAPVIVFEDADIPAAAAAIAEAGYFNAGQDCTAATRVIVHESRHDEFVQALVAAANNTVTGGPENTEALYGPMNNVNHFTQVMDIIAALPANATVAAGGTRVGDTGFFIAPTVITGVKQTDDVVQKESFGPILTVQKFSTEDEAVGLANDVEYALASSVWTANHPRAMRVSRDLDFGCVWINTHIVLAAEMPHGGFKKSGYGKDLSAYGLEDYTRIKHVMTSLDG